VRHRLRQRGESGGGMAKREKELAAGGVYALGVGRLIEAIAASRKKMFAAYGLGGESQRRASWMSSSAISRALLAIWRRVALRVSQAAFGGPVRVAGFQLGCVAVGDRKQRPARPQLLVHRRVPMLKQLVDKPLVLHGFLAADRQRHLIICPGA
jgi:hypothetical protein